MIWKNFALIFALLFLIFGQNIFAQDKSVNISEQKAELIQSGSYGGSELASAYIDTLRNAMRNNLNSKGVFVFYCGNTCKYGEVEAHIRGLNISLSGKGWKTSEFAILQGGYKEKFTVEYWLIPENVGLPIPNSTINIKDVKFKGTFKGKFVPYDCCEY